MTTIGLQNLILALQQALVPSSYQGVVGIGSDANNVVDSVGGFAVNQWQDWGIQFARDTTTAALRGVWQRIASNNGTTHVMAGALPGIPVPGDTYNIRAFGSQIFDLQSVNGTAQTGADWTPLLQRLDVALSTRASEATLAAQLNITLSALRDALAGVGPATVGNLGLLLDQLDVAISTRASEGTLATLATQATLASVLADTTAILAQLDTALSTRASEATLAAQLDIAISALRDAITGAGAAARTQGELETAITGTQPRNMTQIGGTAQTGQDWTLLLRGIANTSRTMQRVIIDTAAAGDTQLIAAVVGQRHKIVHIEIQNPVATNNTALFKDGAAAINGDGFVLGERQGWTFEGDPGRREIVGSVNTAFNINLSAATQISGFVLYYTEA